MSRQYQVKGQSQPLYAALATHFPSPESALQPQRAVRDNDSEEQPPRQPQLAMVLPLSDAYVARTTRFYD